MIIKSLLDTDLYKFTMQQVVWSRSHPMSEQPSHVVPAKRRLLPQPGPSTTDHEARGRGVASYLRPLFWSCVIFQEPAG